jgi:hypothetical protein
MTRQSTLFYEHLRNGKKCTNDAGFPKTRLVQLALRPKPTL